MLLSELAIIYLAAAAPFGVARFLKEQRGGLRSTRRLAKAVAFALAWPLAARRVLAERARDAKARRAGEAHAPYDAQRVELVKRAAVNSLREAEDVLASERETLGEPERHVMFAARECVERYAGLSLACAEAREEDAPSAREMELCRIAGRAGDDLLLAGLCVHRRGVTRLRAHRERARAELLHALAAACEVARDGQGVARGDGGGDAARVFKSAGGRARSERTSESLLRALARSIELMSLFDDRAAVVSAARLLDAECARLRRGGLDATRARAGEGEGVEPCTTQAAHTAFATRPRQTATLT